MPVVHCRGQGKVGGRVKATSPETHGSGRRAMIGSASSGGIGECHSAILFPTTSLLFQGGEDYFLSISSAQIFHFSRRSGVLTLLSILGWVSIVQNVWSWLVSAKSAHAQQAAFLISPHHSHGFRRLAACPRVRQHSLEDGHKPANGRDASKHYTSAESRSAITHLPFLPRIVGQWRIPWQDRI